jgi:alpha-glucosidase
LGRDPVRTPIPWSNEVHGGFTTGTPWLPIDTGLTMDVARQRTDPGSILRLYRDLLRLRRSEPALSLGSYSTIVCTASLLVYERRYQQRRLRVALNMTDTCATLPSGLSTGRVLLSTLAAGRKTADATSVFRPNEGVIFDLEARG